MMKFAFVSRHVPTPEQIELAAKHDVQLDHVGDRDGFTGDFSEFTTENGWDGVVVVHAAAAMHALFSIDGDVGVFENASRPAIDGKMEFFPKALHLYAASAKPHVTGHINIRSILSTVALR